jgi:oxygen-independent coproporphyrinogen-3 oxidase
MYIVLDNGIGKYEVEAILKIFFPSEKFDFNSKENESDYVIFSTDNTLRIKILLDGKNYESKTALPEDVTQIELTACRELYKLLSDITGIKSDWGIITGIRPVKKIGQYAEIGYSEAKIKSKLISEYLISEDKYRLMLSTYRNQSKYLRDIDPKSFSLYIGIPFCPTRCSYCSFVSHSIQSPSAKKLLDEYVEKLIEEIKETALVTKSLGLYPTTIYIGGGTPTTLNSAQISSIMEKIAENFNISRVFEYTVEAGRADTITEEKLLAIKNGGAKRISVNPQTLNNEVLEKIGRKHSSEQFEEAFALAKKVGFDSINCDLIAGLPGDTVESFAHSLDRLIGLNPENITVHTLTLKRAAKLFSQSELYKQSEDVQSMTEYSFRKLTENGYAPYYLYRQKNTIGNQENVGYAKNGYECLYNIYIMEEVQTIIACGAGASTKIFEPESSRLTRIFNYKYPYEYIANYQEVLSRKRKISQIYGNQEENYDT